MLKEEFEKKVGRRVTDEQYKVINTVYTFHPSISEDYGKDEIADLYRNYEFTIILDMYPTAIKFMEFESKKYELREQLSALYDEEREYKTRRGII